MTTTTSATAAPAVGTSLQSTASTRSVTQDYNSQLFLKLLTTQLANQDPSSPMDSTQMIQQTSQLASMEQLTKLTSTTTSDYALQQRSAAADVIGKTVSWTDADGTAKSGVATAVTFNGTDSPTVTIGTDKVALGDLSGIATAPVAPAKAA